MMTTVDKVESRIKRGNFEDAISLATTSLKENPKNGELLISRSTAYLRLGKIKESLEDAERAVVYTSEELRADAQLRRALTLQRLGESGKAAGVLKYAKGCSQPNRIDLLSQRLGNTEPIDVPELPDIPELIEGDIKKVSIEGKKDGPISVPVRQAPAASTQPAIRKDWYQSNHNVNLDVYIRDAKDKNLSVTIENQSVDVKVDSLELKLNLAHPIDTTTSTFNVSPYKISFVLVKKESIQWVRLEGIEGANQADIKQPDQPTKPDIIASPKTAPSLESKKSDFKAAFEKNWDEIDDSDDDDLGKDDPNEFFSQIYKNADPDSQRAMMKSFIESKGTTLSTNWNEVKEGVVEPQPPKDMNIS